MKGKHFTKVLMGLIGLLVVLFLVIAVFGLSVLSKKSKQMTDLKLEGQVLDSQLIQLASTKREVEQYKFFKDVARKAIPNDKNQAQALVDIDRMARESGLEVESFVFPASTLGTKPTAPTPSSPPAQGAGSAPTSTTTPQAAGTTASISQAKPVPGISGLYSLELTIKPLSGTTPASRITYDKMINFFSKIERNRRTAQITNIRIEPSESSAERTIYFELAINIFIKP